MTELKKIKERQKEIYYSGYWLRYKKERYRGDISPVPCGEAGGYYYPDVDYKGVGTSVWEAADHCLRLDYQIISEGRERIENDPEWRKSLLGALKYWVDLDLINSNWWFNQICIPLTLANVALALEEYLTDDLIKGLKRIISRGIFRAHEGISEIEELKGTTKAKIADSWTGANLIWGAATTIKYALWAEDAELLRIAVNRLSDEIAFSREGIQEDGAFCQHGPRWYSGGYGRSFVYEIAPIIKMLGGTSFELSKEKLDIILLHILDGQRAMMKNSVFDFGAVGREYTRKGSLTAGTLTSALSILKDADGIARADELNEFYKELSTGKDNHSVTKYYASIAQLCHKKNGVYIGVRGRTEGIYGAEICNDEGVLSYNMTYGSVSCIMESGMEYFDISPVWDYSRIPGTTARSESDEEVFSHKGWQSMLETPCRAFGMSDADSGILYQLSIHDGISVKAAYFVYNGALIALGTDIRDEKNELDKLFTTVEQSRASFAELGENYVKCGKLTYKNLDEDTVFVSNLEKRKGSWSRNNLSASNETVEDSILTIVIPAAKHGKYAYLACGETEVQADIIRNDSDCQAVLLDGKKLMAVFHNDCALNVNGRTVSGKKGDLILN